MTSKHLRIQHFGLYLKLFRFSSVILLLQLLLVSVPTPVSCQSSNTSIVALFEYRALMAFKHAMIDRRGILRSWNDTTACSGSWAGIKCTKGFVTAIQLPWKGLGGYISDEVGRLTALQKLSLHHNFIQGRIPSSLGLLRNLRSLVLYNNRLSGSIPPSIGNQPQLRTLDLSDNFLTGTIPTGLSNATRLRRLNLSYNELMGPIPNNVIRSFSLVYVDLQSNNLSGSIPAVFGELSELEELHLSHNSLVGSIPEELGKLSKLRTLDLSHNHIDGSFSKDICNISSLSHLNLGSNGIEGPIPEAIDRLHNLSVLLLRKNQLNGQLPSTIGNINSLTKLDVSENNLVGQIPDRISSLPNLDFFNVSFNNLSGSVPRLLSKKFNSSSFRGNLQLCGYAISVPCSSPPPPSAPSNLRMPPPPSDNLRVPQESHRHGKLSVKDVILIVAGSAIALSLVSCSVLICCLIRKRTSSSKTQSSESKKAEPEIGGAEGVESGGQASGKLVHFDGPMVFTADDLLCATAEIMGKSAYGTVYKATFEDGSEVAVKRLREKVVRNRRGFEAAAEALAKIRHPNLLPLRSYYVGPKEEKLLVFDFMPRGSLASFLHARGPHTIIDWPTRMNIAIGVSRGLSHLHTHQNMVHGNLTSGNILLDEHTNPKITDFGLSHLVAASGGNSGAVATAGTVGYRAPELSKAKDATTTKSDVYSLGVIILELLTGKLPGEELNGVDLPHWVASVVNEEWTNEVFDVELTKDASPTAGDDELLNTLKLALHCVDPSPAARPDVQQILQQLEEIKPEVAAAAAPTMGGTGPGPGDDEATEAPPASE